MPRFSTYIGLDVHKNSITLAFGPADLDEPVSKGEKLPNDLPRLLRRLKSFGEPSEVKLCYEAGPTGYGLVRELRALGYTCEVVAPAKTPQVSRERVKTDKRDARRLAEYLRTGHLTEVRVPTEEEESLRDLVRAREDIKSVEVNMRRRLGGLMLRQGRIWRGTKHNWTKAHYEWLEVQEFESRGTQEAKQTYLEKIRSLQVTLKDLDEAIEELVPSLKRADLVRALCALKGVKTYTAAALVSDIGDFKRFPSASKFMSFLGLTPSESSSGDTTRRGAITKAGNGRLRRLLVEAAWTYKKSPHIGRDLARRQRDASEVVRDHAWTAQKRLHKRKRVLDNAGKGSRKITVALARELAGFVWAIGQESDLMQAS